MIIEPDAIANLVTNLNIQKCADAEKVHLSLVTYVIKTLALPNIALYLDGGNSGWLGWPNKINDAATRFTDIYKAAGSPAQLRGVRIFLPSPRLL
jgi:cellulose 1,4-beta-cellobiosidase